MSPTPEQHIWRAVIERAVQHPDVSPHLGGQLGLAIARGIAGYTLYLEVQHDFTLKLLETRLRPAIESALSEVSEAEGVTNFIVMVDPDMDPAELEAANNFAEKPGSDQASQSATTVSTEAEPKNASAESSTLSQQDVSRETSPVWGAESADSQDRSTSQVPAWAEPHHRTARSWEDNSDDSAANDTRATGARSSQPRPISGSGKHAGDRHDDDNPQLNERYSFDTFVIGHSNRLAHAAAVAVAESPAQAYNPLFIYGDSGLGKTHLLHAIGIYARELYGDIKVRYVNSEDFTNDFINSIANNRGAQFQARYRGVDLLLVDDIQFLGGKDETQEAFFHTFNTLHNHNKQVVVTSDVHPKQLRGFEQRMLSRFEWGLLTDIQAPDLETRIAILRRKAEREKLTISNDVLEFIATKFTSNVRELEGTLIRIAAFASLNKRDVDMDMVRTVLKDLISITEDEQVRPETIIQKSADFFHFTVDVLTGSSRSRPIALARQMAMYLCRELTNLSLPEIGRLFGGKDHTTVMHAHKKIATLIKEDRTAYEQVQELTAVIKKSQ